MSEVFNASVVLQDGMHFSGAVNDEVVVQLDAAAQYGGLGKGVQPKPLLLVSLGGCTGMDVISILRKKRQQVSALEVRVTGIAADEHPKVFTQIDVHYVVRGRGVEAEAVERAIDLSMTRYCPVANLLKPVVPIDSTYEIIEE